MIYAGVSTACFYPLVVEQALEAAVESGARCAEVFINAEQEFTRPFFQELSKRARRAGVDIVSVHPYTSGFEPMYFFSNYPRRFQDGLEAYRRYFDLASGIGARYFILHGALLQAKLEDREIYERYGALYRVAKEHGVTLLQENVSRCKSRDPAFIRAMGEYLGDEVGFVLDVKQAVRAGAAAADMLDAMGGRLRHVHFSDHAPGCDCLPPGRGTFDIPGFIRSLRKMEYDGALILELYRENYASLEELYASVGRLQALLGA